ncbi:YbaB/EbfC family nucleoid-associated protein [Nocardia arthritidis]|uniref:YbaB/EbfC family DNA-binding protein n=1 Tax=Nocardia arthritidis TaxID=228602 RepID=A0A6G9Y6X4_9NOCA|nr:YbaB/EbfC family nucleoid-associated protein [Nocardia arthritidis]QIS08962.1 YbaB/EbfC family DNA-binding protein [Nocardia arthritidis]
MTNAAAKAEVADLLETVQRHIRSLAGAHRQRTLLTATATAGDRRIRVTVNADGIPVQITFAEDVSDLEYDEIAAATVEAAQAAATEVRTKAEKLYEPLQKAHARLPSLSEMVEGMPDLRKELPKAQPAALTPPPAQSSESATTAMTFENVEYRPDSSGSMIAEDDNW